jgi:hypothetical protein
MHDWYEPILDTDMAFYGNEIDLIDARVSWESTAQGDWLRKDQKSFWFREMNSRLG